MNIDLIMARKHSERLLDATSTWTSTTSQTWTVPADRRWFLIGLGGSRSASGTIAIKHLNKTGGMLFPIADIADSASTWVCPNTFADVQNWQNGGVPLVLDAGEQITLAYGAAQGAAAYHSIVVLEVTI